jgi:hypothetical protein
MAEELHSGLGELVGNSRFGRLGHLSESAVRAAP